jgi:hypothetical protein
MNLGNSTCMVAPSNSFGSYSSAANAPPAVIQGGAGLNTKQSVDLVLPSTSVYYASDSAANVLFARGWELP